MAKFGAPTEELTLDGKTFTFHALSVAEVEGAVDALSEDAWELNAKLISLSCKDFKTLTPEELKTWPMVYFRKVVDVVQRLNGLGSYAEGN